MLFFKLLVLQKKNVFLRRKFFNQRSPFHPVSCSGGAWAWQTDKQRRHKDTKMWTQKKKKNIGYCKESSTVHILNTCELGDNWDPSKQRDEIKPGCFLVPDRGHEPPNVTHIVANTALVCMATDDILYHVYSVSQGVTGAAIISSLSAHYCTAVYSVLCTVYSVLSTVYCVQCTVYWVQYTVYSVLFSVYCVQFNVYSVLCIVYCVQCTVFSELCWDSSRETWESGCCHKGHTQVHRSQQRRHRRGTLYLKMNREIYHACTAV